MAVTTSYTRVVLEPASQAFVEATATPPFLYEMTPDHNALVGEADGVSRFLYATGFSGHGFLMGPAIGEVMRDLYLGRSPVVDVSPLTADRFAGSALRPELNIV